MILIDTDVIIWILRGDETVRGAFGKVVMEANGYIFVTPIQFAEIYAGIKSNEEKRIEKFFSSFNIIPIDKETGKLAGLFMKQYSKSHHVALADALIAASSKLNNFKLWTGNKKHYPMLEKGEFV